MKILITVEVDLENGEYQITFKNKSNPGLPMSLDAIKNALTKVAKDFTSENPHEVIKQITN